jgi:hypothetical protein
MAGAKRRNPGKPELARPAQKMKPNPEAQASVMAPDSSALNAQRTMSDVIAWVLCVAVVCHRVSYFSRRALVCLFVL